MITKKTITFLLICFLVLGCKKDTRDYEAELHTKIDTLLAKSNDYSFNKSSRLRFADSVSIYLEDVKSDSLRKFYTFKLANRYYNLRLLEKYKKITLNLRSNSIADNDILTQTRCDYNLGGYYYEKYNLDSCFYYYNKAKKFSNALDDLKLKAEIYKDFGRVLFYQNQYLESEKNISVALQLSKKINNHEYVFECYSLFGLSELGMKNYRKALEYFTLAQKTLENIKEDTYHPVLMAQNYINFCDVYFKKKDYKNLYFYSQKGVFIKDLKFLEISTYAYLKNYYGYAKLKLGDVSSIAEFKESLKIGDSLKFEPIQNTSNLNLGEYHLLYHDTLFANEAFKNVYKSKIIDDKLKALLLLSKSNPKKASDYFEKYKSLSDSLINTERQTREKFARIEYETNEIISEKDVIQKQKESILQQLWSVSSIAVLIILVVLLFYFIKSRNIKNKELKFIQEQQNAKEEIYNLMLNQQHRIEEGKNSEKNRISQELHDGVMGKLMGIRLNLFILKKKQDAETIQKCLPFIDDIQSIEKEIRQIAHDLNQNLFDDNVTFISIVENLFTMIKSHSDIEFNLLVDERIDWDLINNNIKINIYRIIQETLQNIDKYAQASKVNLNMNKKENEIHITIADNGIGFNPDTNKKGIGLSNMKKRMEEINGSFSLETKIKIGTKITLVFQI